MKYLYSLIFLCTALCYSQTSSTDNYLTNGDFENGTTGFTTGDADGTLSVETINVIENSSSSLKWVVSQGATANTVFRYNSKITVTDEQFYHFGIWIKSETAGASFKLGGNNVTAGGVNDFPRSKVITLNDTEWHYVMYSKLMAENSQIQPIIWTDDDAATFYLDDAELFAGTPSRNMELAVHNNVANGDEKTLPADALLASEHFNFQNYNGGNHIGSWAYDSTEKKSGYRSLKVTTAATANETDWGVIVHKLNDGKGYRLKMYENQKVGGIDYTYIEYTASVWVKSNNTASFQLNFKVAGENNFSGVKTLTAGEWTEVTRKVTAPVSAGTVNGATIMPLYQFGSASTDYFIDDFKITWIGTNTLNSETFSSNQISLYPNPAQDFVVLNNKPESLENIDIYSITGSLVKSVDLNYNSDKVDIQDLAPGLYFLKADESQPVKFIKK
ncbi:MAG: T9SS type A sorting domain-containing protein [Flavobacteriaceae bacterium]|jgi:hypothetical protein